MQAVVQEAEASFGPCDFMVCNAGATHPGDCLLLAVVHVARLLKLQRNLCRQNRGFAN